MGNRGEEGVHLDMNREIQGVRQAIMYEETRREEEDCTVLDSMLDAQKELQRIVLQNFGTTTVKKLELGGEEGEGEDRDRKRDESKDDGDAEKEEEKEREKEQKFL